MAWRTTQRPHMDGGIGNAEDRGDLPAPRRARHGLGAPSVTAPLEQKLARPFLAQVATPWPPVRWRRQIRCIYRRCNLLGRREGDRPRRAVACTCSSPEKGLLRMVWRRCFGAAPQETSSHGVAERHVVAAQSHWALVRRVRDEEMHVCFGMFRRSEGRRRQQQLLLQCRRWNRGDPAGGGSTQEQEPVNKRAAQPPIMSGEQTKALPP
jgi:hypothetical protein